MKLQDLLALEPGAREQFNSLWLGYTDSRGAPQLRQAISLLYEKVAADQVLVHAGAEEAIFNFMNVVLNPGDHIIVHAPYYQSLGEVARCIGAEVSEWRGDSERAWELHLDDLQELLTARTRVVVVNFPHNPTGFLPTPEFICELSALSDRNSFIIFSDEVYRGLELDRADRLPAVADVNERAVSLGVMSKSIRSGRTANRLARDPRRRSLPRIGDIQGLYDHLQQRSKRVLGNSGVAPGRDHRRTESADHPRQPRSSRRILQFPLGAI
jgi:aspartate/methionine/tyrosine aminotransferase